MTKVREDKCFSKGVYLGGILNTIDPRGLSKLSKHIMRRGGLLLHFQMYQGIFKVVELVLRLYHGDFYIHMSW